MAAVKAAVVLFNLGGPDGPDAIAPFLLNLFSDPAILRQPTPVRWLLARLISSRRTPLARESYGRIGGKSPLLEETRKQAEALAAALAEPEARTFVCMRYWHPMADEVAESVKRFAPSRIVLLPLYPQYSTATAASSMAAWHAAAGRVGLTIPTRAVCCYPTASGFIDALTRLTRRGLDGASGAGTPRILFSAHGLPQSFIDRGDPYRYQVEATVAAVLRRLGPMEADHVICYQSRVGRLEWLRPYTEDEIRRAGADRRPIVVVPVAFVSEHVETLVELDLDYRALAERTGVPLYVRTPTVGSDPAFVGTLADLVRGALGRPAKVAAECGGRLCPAVWRGCPVPVKAEAA
jgi:ferrochelatase